MTLGLASNVRLSAATIAAAFGAKAREVHPDAGGSGDGAAMAMLIQARDLLMLDVGKGD